MIIGRLDSYTRRKNRLNTKIAGEIRTGFLRKKIKGKLKFSIEKRLILYPTFCTCTQEFCIFLNMGYLKN